MSDFKEWFEELIKDSNNLKNVVGFDTSEEVEEFKRFDDIVVGRIVSDDVKVDNDFIFYCWKKYIKKKLDYKGKYRTDCECGDSIGNYYEQTKSGWYNIIIGNLVDYHFRLINKNK